MWSRVRILIRIIRVWRTTWIWRRWWGLWRWTAIWGWWLLFLLLLLWFLCFILWKFFLLSYLLLFNIFKINISTDCIDIFYFLILLILFLTAWFIFNSSFKIRIPDESLWPFIFVQSHFDLLFVHDCSTGTISISNLILALISIMTKLQAPLTSNSSWTFLFIAHIFIWLFCINSII